MFWELHAGRGSGMSGPLPLSWTEIKCWADLHGVDLTGFELTAIRAMDGAYLQAAHKQMDSKAKKKK
jgi:hypothetical protein